MDEETILDSAVAQKDRISVDVSDIKQEIENCRTDLAWAELALSAKVRVLVKERLEQIKLQALEERQDNGMPLAQNQTPSPSKRKGTKD